MRFTFVASALVALASVASSAPLTGVSSTLVEPRQFIDYGPPLPINCSTQAEKCPSSPGPSGTLNSPRNGDVLTSVWDNSGHFDFSYTPVSQAVGDGKVETTSVIVTLRQYFYGVPAYADEPIILAALGAPDDFSTINARLSLPGRVWDGDSVESNDNTGFGGQQSGDRGMYGLQVIEQQRWTKDANSKPVLIEFFSASPLVNVTFIAPE